MMAAQDSDIASPPALSKKPSKPEIILEAVERHSETYQFTFQYANANTMLYLSNIFAMLLFACGLPMVRSAILDHDNSTQLLETAYKVNYGAGAAVVIFTVILVILALQIIVPLQSVCLDPTLVWKSTCVVGITSFVAGCLGIRTTFSNYLGGLFLVLVLMHVLNLALRSRWTPLFFNVNARLSHPVNFQNGWNSVQILVLYVLREYCYVIWMILAVRAWICLEVIYMRPTQCLNPDAIVTNTIPYFSWTAGWFVYLVYIIWLTTITYRGFVKMDEMDNVARSSCYSNSVLKIVEFSGIESKTQNYQEDRLYRFMRIMRSITLPKTIATNETGELMTNDFVSVYWEKDQTLANQLPIYSAVKNKSCYACSLESDLHRTCSVENCPIVLKAKRSEFYSQVRYALRLHKTSSFVNFGCPSDNPTKDTAALHKLVQKKTTSDEDSLDEDLMQLSSASMLQQVMDVDGSYGMETIAIGVDFGAAYFRVDRWINGKFERITDESGADAFSAFFGRKDGQYFFGQEAREMSTVDPANVIFDVMRFAALDSQEALDKVKYGMYPFNICDLEDTRDFDFQLSDESTASPIEIIQCFLIHVRKQCEKLFGLQKFSLAITVPSYWNESIRESKETKLLDAARRSGFTRVNLIDSQVAATLGCYLVMKDSKIWLKDILVVDVGTTDITATISRSQLEDETETETFTVTGVGLGCTSSDQALMRYLKEQFIAEYKLPVDTAVGLTAWHLLRMECEKARVSLTTTMATVLSVLNFVVGYDLRVELTRDRFDDIVGSTIADDVVGITEQALALSKINIELFTKDNFRLFLVGGGSRIPCIQQRMTAEFGSKISFAALEYCEDAAVYGAAGYARMIELEPNVVKLDIVQHYRDICDLLKNHGKPEGGDGAARLATCRSGCTHMYTVPAVAFFDRMTPIIPSMHGISIKTDRVSYRFSIRSQISDWPTNFISSYRAQLQHIELTPTTAASLQLQQRHMTMLSFEGTLEQEDLTDTGAFGNFQGRMGTIRNPFGLCHPNVVRCLAVGRTPPMSVRRRCLIEVSYRPFEKEYVRVLLDMRLNDDSLHDHLFPSSGLDITLHRFCKERGSSLGNKEIINKMKQLLDGLSYLHGLETPFILASLTSSGILVTPDGETVKIWDILFGLLDKSPSQLYPNVPSYFTNDLLAYAHPDVSNYILEVSRDHEKCPTLTFQPCMDIWSLGCVVLDMMSRGNHFSCINRHGLPLNDHMESPGFVRTMVNGGRPLIPSSAPDIIRQLCTKCFEREPNRRTDALGLLAMLSQTSENEIDVCSTEEPKFKQTSAFLFTVSKDVWFEVKLNTFLAEGSYGYVYTVDIPNTVIPESSISNNIPEAVHHALRDRRTLALKILRHCELDESKRDLLVSLSHNHIVMYICTGMVPIMPGDIYARHLNTGILMEYYTGGTLNQRAKEQDLSATEILEFARQIASGLAYLHDTRNMSSTLGTLIVHGNLKGQVILMTSAKPITIKIGGLDSLTILEDRVTEIPDLRIKEGTLTHMSPEMVKFAFTNEEDTKSKLTNIGSATDIYSVGCIILEMFNRGNVPYSNVDGSKLTTEENRKFAYSVSRGAHPDLSVTDAKGIQLDFRQLLRDCLQREPRERPTASHLLKALTKLRSSAKSTSKRDDMESIDATDT